MRINEAYEHEPILPYQSEESCPLNGCNKVSTQCVDVTASVILSPPQSWAAHRHLSGQSHHHLRHQCRRNHVHRDYDPEGSVSPSRVRYGTTISTCDPTITCAESCIGCGGC